MQLVIRNARVANGASTTDVDIGVHGGKIVQLGTHVPAADEDIDVQGRLVVPGFVETPLAARAKLRTQIIARFRSHQ